MRPIRYALWSLLAIVPLGFALMLLSGAMFDVPRLTPTDMGPMTSVMAVAAFMITALIAPGIVDPEGKSLPTWSAVSILAGVVQLLVLFFVYSVPSTEVWAYVYVPTAVVCLNLAALIITHVWVACEGFGFPLAIGLGVGGACAGWIIHAGSMTEFGVFHAVSAIALGTALTAGIVCALTTKDDGHVAVERHGRA